MTWVVVWGVVGCAARSVPPPPVVVAEEAPEETPPGSAPSPEGVPSPGAVERYAVARLAPASGSAVTGIATFREVEQPPREPGERGDTDLPVPPTREVSAVVEVRGADPGVYTLRVHEVGDCSAPDASSAGLVFGAHGGTEDIAGRAAGDLGQIEIGADGTAVVDITTDRITLGRDERSVVDRALVVSRPLGGSAERRVACGVIVAEVAAR